jgi:cytochrome c peroxidase
LFYITKNPKDIGKFRTPSLRELKYTAPYMHNGMLAKRWPMSSSSMTGVVARRSNKTPLLKPLKLTAQEKKDLRRLPRSPVDGQSL